MLNTPFLFLAKDRSGHVFKALSLNLIFKILFTRDLCADMNWFVAVHGAYHAGVPDRR